MRRPLVVIASALVAAVLTACSSVGGLASGGGSKASGKDTGKAPEVPPREDQSEHDDEIEVDPPIWVQGSFLSCNWASVEEGMLTSASCALEGEGGAPEGLVLAWEVVNADGSVEEIPQKGQAGARTTFVMDARLYAGRTVRLVVSLGEITRTIERRFAEELPGLAEGEPLRTCFEANADDAKKTDVGACFADAGIILLEEETVTAPKSSWPKSPNAEFRVFVSSLARYGDMSGLKGADVYCQKLGSRTGLRGYAWRALLGSQERPVLSLVPPEAKLMTVAGTLLSDSMTTFVVRGASLPSLTDELKAAITSSAEIWTGWSDGGKTNRATCLGWTSSAQTQAGVAVTHLAPLGWTGACNGACTCNKARRLLCVGTPSAPSAQGSGSEEAEK